MYLASSVCEGTVLVGKQMKEILPKFENQKLDDPFAPSYGVERARQVAESCNE